MAKLLLCYLITIAMQFLTLKQEQVTAVTGFRKAMVSGAKQTSEV
jgi:hypothetical protein